MENEIASRVAQAEQRVRRELSAHQESFQRDLVDPMQQQIDKHVCVYRVCVYSSIATYTFVGCFDNLTQIVHVVTQSTFAISHKRTI